MQASISEAETHKTSYVDRSRLLPFLFYQAGCPQTCHECGVVNQAENNYCTHCGYPVIAEADKIALYNFRQHKRGELLQDCEFIIGQARAVLYIMAAITFAGISYFFNNIAQNYLRAGVLLMISGIYFGLARWTLSRPFTALLISFLMLISFMAINTWAEFRRMFTTATGVYLLVVQLALFYFLFRGVKAAYQADILVEEENT